MLISDLEGAQRREDSPQNQSEHGQREPYSRGDTKLAMPRGGGFPFCYCFLGCLTETGERTGILRFSPIKTFKM